MKYLLNYNKRPYPGITDILNQLEHNIIFNLKIVRKIYIIHLNYNEIKISIYIIFCVPIGQKLQYYRPIGQFPDTQE